MKGIKERISEHKVLYHIVCALSQTENKEVTEKLLDAYFNESSVQYEALLDEETVEKLEEARKEEEYNAITEAREKQEINELVELMEQES